MIKVGEYKVTEKDKEAVMEVLNSGKVTEGKKVREFEKKWADYIGTKYCVLTNSGTSALMVALEVIKKFTRKDGSPTVLTSPLTFIATVNAIFNSGCLIEFSDVNKETMLIEPCVVKADVFMPVHLYGYPVDMDKFNYRWVIEDACEAHGTLYKGKKVGSIGNMGCFSFYVAHNIQVGDMGCVTTNDLETYKLLNKLKAHGRMCECYICRRSEGLCPHKGKDFDPRFTFTEIAHNFKTSEFNAALGLNQIEQADEILAKRRENVQCLNILLAQYSDILQLPRYDENVSYLAYPIIVKDPQVITRDKLRIELEKRGIETRPLFNCVPTQQPAYDWLSAKWRYKLPNAEWLGNNGLHIGCHQYMTDGDLDFIADSFKEILC